MHDVILPFNNFFKMKNILITFLFFLMLMFNYNLFAQEGTVKIKGTVIDAKTGNALPGANILVVGTNKGTSTDVNGEYSLELLPGRYQLQVSFVSYRTLKAEITLEAGKTLIRDFQLNADLIGTDEVVVLGTRTRDRTVVDSPVPIDVITAKEIERSGFTQTTELIKMLVPSYNAPENTITDGSDHVRPAALRGLGPDQVLVLINGKRRHTSALVHVNGSIGRGSTGADLNAIPASVIDRIEVLRDGASAQYGSDAIAGVINIVLKDKKGLDVSATYGQHVTTQERGYAETEANIEGDDAATYSWDGNVEDVSITDGASKILHLGYGFDLYDGVVYISGQLRQKDYTNRAGLDPRQQYFSQPDGSPDPREASFDRLNHRFGDAETSDYGVFLNSSIPINDNTSFYAFGGYSYRNGLSGGFYRRSLDDRNVRAIYPDGFLPKIETNIYDGSFAAGVKGSLGKWAYDVSETFGGNTFVFNVTNSLNTSMGTASPTDFHAGDLKFYQSTTNIDFVRQLEIGTAQPLNIAAGFEFRWENYQLAPGEYNSYADGGVPILDGPNAGNPAPTGAQVFPGFSPVNTQDETRTNFGLYADFENHVTSNWLLGAAGRYEYYSDFGSTVTGKVNTRYELLPGFALRGAVSTGFRAPSLAQAYFSSIATVFIGGVPYEVGTFPVSSDVAKALGAEDLTAEKSVNVSAGFTFSATNFSLTIDGYQINIEDRIVLTENFTGEGITTFLQNQNINASGGRFFTNALNTKTYGVDITSRYGVKLGAGTLRITAALNFNKTEITNRNDIQTPDELAAVTSIPLLGRVEQGRFEKGQPTSSWNFMGSYNIAKWNFMVRAQRFGEVTSYNNDPARDQTYGALWVVDAEAAYDIISGLQLAVGVNNIFDTYPDKTLKINSFNGIFQFSGFSPSGFNGRYIYSRVNFSI